MSELPLTYRSKLIGDSASGERDAERPRWGVGLTQGGTLTQQNGTQVYW